MLSVVPTPIGNLGDITLRAIETFRACDLVAAEDTRHTGLLLAHLGIKKPFLSLHEHNEASRCDEIIARLRAGTRIALATDAGMPAISDPGTRLIRAVIAENLPLEILPGPCAAIVAAVGSGMDLSSFRFAGFLPNKSGRREKALREAVASAETTIFYESPYRLVKTLETLALIAPSHPACVARELTKKFEDFHRGTASELLSHYSAHPPKGEICLVIGTLPKPRPSRPESPDSDSAGI